MIPANIDYQAIVTELNDWGILDSKIELICGYSQGYIGHLQKGTYADMTYQRAARLYNFWAEERLARGLSVFTVAVPLFESNQHLAATT